MEKNDNIKRRRKEFKITIYYPPRHYSIMVAKLVTHNHLDIYTFCTTSAIFLVLFAIQALNVGLLKDHTASVGSDTLAVYDEIIFIESLDKWLYLTASVSSAAFVLGIVVKKHIDARREAKAQSQIQSTGTSDIESGNV